jgi:alpha-amylase
MCKRPRNTPKSHLCPLNLLSHCLQHRAGFGWDSCREGGWWQKIAGKAQEIADQGFTHIWLPPPSQSVSEEGYLPSQLYNFNSKYGSEHDLRACLDALNAAGVAPVADLVFNHRCADTQNKKGDWVIFSCDPHAAD